MSIKLIHTSDWHLGQTFYDFDRSYEHQQFLVWLKQLLVSEDADVLLISGDVFDVSNPAASAVSMFYRFLAETTRCLPQLQVIVIAGNHDSAARLEAPNPILHYLNVSITGSIEYDENGNINFRQMIVPLRNKAGVTEAVCLAVPFLRPSDLGMVSNTAYSEKVAAFYHQLYSVASGQKQPNEAIVAMGHLHLLNAELSENDKSERAILGGIEYVPLTAFDPQIAYVALGHIHKAQCIGKNEYVRYCGTPLPMSFSERNYHHQVVAVTLDEGKPGSIRQIEVPVTVELLCVPTQPKPLMQVLDELFELSSTELPPERQPYLEVRVLLDEPQPELRNKIETAIEHKAVRLAKIDVHYKGENSASEQYITGEQLQNLEPLSLFNRIYQNKFNEEPPLQLVELFNQVTAELNAKEV